MASGSRLHVLLTEQHERILARWEALLAVEPRESVGALRDLAAPLIRALAQSVSSREGFRAGGRKAVREAAQGLDRQLAPPEIVRAFLALHRAIVETWLEAGSVDPRSASSPAAGARGPLEDLASLDAGLGGAVEEAVARLAAEHGALHESEEKLRALANAMPQIVCVLAPDGSVEDVNPSWTAFSGLDLEATRRAGWPTVVHPDDLPAARDCRQRVLRSLTPEDVELRYRAADGSYRWFLSRLAPILDGSRVIRLVGAAMDIEDRRRLEQELREQLALKDQLAKVAASVPGVVCSFRMQPDGRVSMPFSAPAIEELYGFSQQELARDMSPVLARSLPEELDQTLRSVAESARTMTLWHHEFRYQHPTKGLRWIEGTSIPTPEEGGSIIWHGFVADVTDRKAAEERLRDANDRLRESDRRKDEFLGMLSHELRNPLAPIRNALYILDHVEPDGPQARRARVVATRQVAHLTRLVDDLLDVTRIARGKIELRRADVDLVAVAQRAGEDHRALMEDREIALEIHLPPGTLVVNGDETRLAQVLGNLLGNAAKFTPRGGRVVLEVEGRAGRAVIRVRDDGLGVDREMLESIFDPFTQAKQSLARTEGGLGLGLALVKGLVGLHGGTVSAASEGSGRGTEFVVTLPVAAPAAAREGGVAGAAPAAGPFPRRHVLVVDDNADAAETLAQLVQMLGHEAEIAHDGPSALALARARAPDVVLCDIGLPGMDGYAVARVLRGERPSSRLVAVSGYAQPEDLATAAASGFERHLAKPLDPQKLAELLT